MFSFTTLPFLFPERMVLCLLLHQMFPLVLSDLHYVDAMPCSYFCLWHWALPEQSVAVSAMLRLCSQPTFLLPLMLLTLPYWQCLLSVYMHMSVCVFDCSYRCIIPTRLYSMALISWSKCATVSQCWEMPWIVFSTTMYANI